VLDVEKKSSRGENRYLWRHNCVLRILARAIQTKVEQVNKSPIRPALEPIKFVAAGSKSAPQQKPVRFGMLEEARDWKCDFDLPELHPEGSQFVFPYDVCMTPSRIDGYIVSRKAKVCLAGPELTVPMEERIHHWHTAKFKKYEELVMCRASGWQVHRLVLEVGSRGFIPPSFVAVLKKLGFPSQEISVLKNKCSLMSQRCSYIIWLNRANSNFIPMRLTD